ncbi:MAG: hypothetical protein BGO98_10925 [Myxococcales bacterium 68-20]|nr:MAG: hypothetical protein BGO98_10925 [Myxococcales bacterium 68-20]
MLARRHEDATSARRRWGPRSVTAAVCVVIAGAAGSARAEDVARAYEAPPECPGPPVFAAEVEKRTAGRAPRDARITITRSAVEGYDGRLFLDGVVRDVHAATCGETVQALALAVALAAEDGVEDEPEPAPAPAAPSPAPVAESDPDDAAEAPSRVAKRGHALFGLGFGGTSALGTGLSPELAIFGGVDVDGRSLRAGVTGARGAVHTSSIGTSRVERLALFVDGCPVSARAGLFRLSPCARFDVGFLHGSGDSLENAESRSLLWLALSAGGRAGFNVTDALFVETDARAAIPLVRHEFFVRPNDVVYRVPTVAVELSVALGYRFSK